jgi:hypothetical protein
MLMLKCKRCGEVFPGVYVPEDSNDDFKSTITSSARLTPVQEDTKKSTLQKNIWIGPN